MTGGRLKWELPPTSDPGARTLARVFGDAPFGVQVHAPAYLNDSGNYRDTTTVSGAGGGVRVVAQFGPDDGEPGELCTAAEASTGAMVALIPTEADAARLAVDGGEPADELHVTLAYLGDAVDLSPADRQDLIDAVSTAVNGFPLVEAQAFALNVFNPGKTSGWDTCVVLGLSGELLDAAHTVVNDALNHEGVNMPRQHAPWHAHLTLTYTDDLTVLAGLVDRVGPVRFDRLRIAIAGQHIDIPLLPEPEPADDGEDADPEEVQAAAGGENNLREFFTRNPKGLARWASKPHPWTALYRILRRHVGSERAKRIASSWFHRVFGYWPGDRRHRKASAVNGDDMPNPNPTLAERIHQAWNASNPPEQQWIVEAAETEVIVMDNSDRSLLRVPVTVDGDAIRFGQPERVRTAYVSADAPVEASRMVFASVAESRPDVAAGIDGDEVEAHATHNQKTHGRRYKTPGDRSSGLREPRRSSLSSPGARPERTSRSQPAPDPAADKAEIRSVAGELKRRVGTLPDLSESESKALAQARKEHGLPSQGDVRKLKQSRDVDEKTKGEVADDLYQAVRELATARKAKENNERQGAVLDEAQADTSSLRPATVAYLDGIRKQYEEVLSRNDDMIAKREAVLKTAIRKWKAFDDLRTGEAQVSRTAREVDPHQEGRAARDRVIKDLGLPTGKRIQDLIYSPSREQEQAGWAAWQLPDLAEGLATKRAELSNLNSRISARKATISSGQMRQEAIEEMQDLIDLDTRRVKELTDEIREQQSGYDRYLTRWQQNGDSAGRPIVMASDPFSADLGDSGFVDLFADLGDGLFDNALGDSHEPPAAEPGTNNNPSEEDSVSDWSEISSRLGLGDDADEAAVLAALDELKNRADNAPDPEQVKASAVKQGELEKEVQVLASQVQTMSAKLAATEAEKAATVKASVIGDAVKQGKIRPAEREQWEADYDQAPGAITRVLASIAPGTAVPVQASGYTGDPDSVSAGAFDDAEYERIFGEKAGA